MSKKYEDEDDLLDYDTQKDISPKTSVSNPFFKNKVHTEVAKGNPDEEKPKEDEGAKEVEKSGPKHKG